MSPNINLIRLKKRFFGNSYYLGNTFLSRFETKAYKD